jgi:uncharacterized membrane protein YbaN (DUF454 family)
MASMSEEQALILGIIGIILSVLTLSYTAVLNRCKAERFTV